MANWIGCSSALLLAVLTPLDSNAAVIGGNHRAGNCGDAHTPIAAIQGTTDTSPLAGSAVSVEAVVTAVFQSRSQLGGFFIQEPARESDGNARASAGLFVYAASPTVQAGDRVRVHGPVSEYFGLTQLTPTALAVCASGQLLPAPAPIHLPVAARSELEAFESMRVTLPQTLTVSATGELARLGQVLLSNGRLYMPTHQVAPGAAAQALRAQNLLNQLLLDDGSNVRNPDPIIFPAPGLTAGNTLRGGDTAANITGVLSYAFGQYRVIPTAAPVFTRNNPRLAAPRLPAAGLRVASFNLHNFFNGDGDGGGFPAVRGADDVVEYARQKEKIVSALLGLEADIIGLTELENDGYGARAAIARLVDALNAAGGGGYAFVDPGVTRIGTDAIAVGLIYRSGKVMLQGNAALLDTSVTPLFNDAMNRPVLAQTFKDGRGAALTLAIVHLKSKGSDCNDLGDVDTGDGQGNCAVTRAHAAKALAAWLATDPTDSGDTDFLIIGDLNAYAQEHPITALKNAGYTDLVARFAGTGAHSYVFDGQAGYLDHALASVSLLPQVAGATNWPINADEPSALDYDTRYKSARQIGSLYSGGPYRSSDHDPLVVALNLAAVEPRFLLH
jgi:uncharacterized protein